VFLVGGKGNSMVREPHVLQINRIQVHLYWIPRQFSSHLRTALFVIGSYTILSAGC